ncbi:MAG: VOC family protein [Candidatus Latescibacterota bacterium]|jgi:catechol 2,3-dioxygenase-like lactoylglutathione lyase family enzyme
MAAGLLFEHFAMNVADPAATAAWYCRHLGMKVVRQGEGPTYMHFLADCSARVVVEIYRSATEPVPAYAGQHPQILHLAFATTEVEVDRQRLLAAGATAEGEITLTEAGDRLAMLRDPWGFALQLCQRTRPMV